MMRFSRLDRRLQRIADLTDVGVVLLSSDKEVDLASRRALALLRMSTEDEAGWRRLVARLEQAVDRFWAAHQDGQIVELEWTTGEAPKWLTFQIYFLDEDECEGFLILVRDRSLQRSIEADLALAAQLRNLSRLYLGLAHDLRSPLNAIVLHLELLKGSFRNVNDSANDMEQRARWLEVLEEKSRHLSDSLDALLSQTVEPAAEPTLFDLGEVIGDLTRLLASQAGQQGIAIEVLVGAEPLPVEGRRDRIKRALLNIAINGLDATPRGGRLVLAGRCESNDAVVSITDTGPGIAPEAVGRVFDLHFTTKTTGTGLGLFVARSAIEADGGKLTLESSSPGKTSFEVRLPLAPA